MRALSEIKRSSEIHGYTDQRLVKATIPIAGVAGDQQSAAFAQGCSPQGIVKNTYGTGLFVVADIGRKIKLSERLVTTVGATDRGALCYALEGSIFIGGAAIQWLRDGLSMLKSANQTELLVKDLKSNEGVYFVPALAGLGCPHWDPRARGMIIGITRQTSSRHFVRAALESMAYQTCDVAELFRREMKIRIRRLRVDGGAVRNDWLMQFQADLLGCEVERPVISQTTALGAAALAGIATGIWKDRREFLKFRRVQSIFRPRMKNKTRNKFYREWKKALSRSLEWTD